MYTVIQTDRGAADKIVELGVFEHCGLDVEFVRLELEGEDAVIEACAGAHALVPAYAPLTARVLDTMPDLRIVAFMATGYNSVDMAAATERGIVVTNVPDYCTQEVADHAMGFLLALGRNLLRHHGCILDGQWDYGACGKPDRISHQTLGIIGLGRIGRAVAQRAQAFGLTIVASDPYVDEATMKAFGVRKTGLDEVLGCDYVSLHCALTPETTGIIDAAALAAMKPSAYLINTARGACVDDDALAAALAAGEIAGAALDVLYPEPLPAGHPLYALENVMLTPHTAFMSRVSEEEVREKACLEVVRALRGETPHYVVNTEVLGSPVLRLAAPRAS